MGRNCHSRTVVYARMKSSEIYFAVNQNSIIWVRAILTYCVVLVYYQCAHHIFAGELFFRQQADGGMAIDAMNVVVVQKKWLFSMTEHRVAGSVRGGAMLNGAYRFNFVKIKYIASNGHANEGYVQLRGLLKVIDLTRVTRGPMRVRVKAEGRLVFLGRCVRMYVPCFTPVYTWFTHYSNYGQTQCTQRVYHSWYMYIYA